MDDPMTWRLELSKKVARMDTDALRARYAELEPVVIPSIPDGVNIWDWELKRGGTEEQKSEYAFVEDELRIRESDARDAAWDAYLRHEESQDLPHRTQGRRQ